MAVDVRRVHLNKSRQPGLASDRCLESATALVLSSRELDRIKSHSNWLAKQHHDGVDRQRQIEKMKVSSQSIVKKWKNTVLNKQKERLERRLERLQMDEDRKNAIYQASLQEAAEKRRTIIEDARRMILFDRDDIHQVNSAFVFSEVLRERAKQLEFKKHLRNMEESNKRALAEKIKLDTQVYQEQEAERLVREHDAKMERKAQNIKMMKEKEENEALLLSSEKEHEKQDLLDMQMEINQVKENIEKEIQRKKEHVKRDALESIALKKEKEIMQSQEAEDEEKVIQIYCQVKQRMGCMRQRKECEARQNKLEQQDRIRAIIAENLKAKEEDVDSMIFKALQEREQREAETLKKRQEYEAKLLKERQDYMVEVQNLKSKEKKEDMETKQWVVMQRLKRDEIDKVVQLKKKESEWATKMVVRHGYNTQLEEQRNIKEKEWHEEELVHNYLMKRNQKVDEDFLKYAQEVLEECKTTGRPLYPVQKVVHEYRKRHGIIQREQYEKWAKENEELQKCDGENPSQQLKLISMPDTKFFDPLIKRCKC